MLSLSKWFDYQILGFEKFVSGWNYLFTPCWCLGLCANGGTNNGIQFHSCTGEERPGYQCALFFAPAQSPYED